MNILINGTAENISNNTTISEYLKSKHMNPDHIVIAINDNVIEREAYNTTKLNEKDNVDLMSFVGGG